MKRPDRFDVLLLLGTASGAVGSWAIWPPLAFLFVTGVAFTLAGVIDRRTVVTPRSRRSAK
jgi:hypothetical protein